MCPVLTPHGRTLACTMCVLTCTRCVVWLAVRTDQNGSAHVVFRRLSQRQTAVRVSPHCGCGAFDVRALDPCFLSQWTHRLRGIAQVTSIASLDERNVRAVAFTTNLFIQCFAAEHLLGTCLRLSSKKDNTCGFEVLRFMGGLVFRQQVVDPETSRRKFHQCV